ncbi:DUF2721 domain-containing protein [Kineobactrum salinum]|uniref:DUF2721 domain-containing protein n=1 Tax=Kineobactrum salinum TaxID=2708301 RepID=A0A6C0U379_9GAMM|nr:DUF2721 domain-containing protein [Kineobactrum salinum]QIB66476.1 DUF2721 domain-containing protein [Kineobactrum salinum]
MDDSITALASIIQIAVAPVFLLAGIAGFLNVMSGRLGRIVDRARIIERRVNTLSDEARLGRANHELRTLWRRVHIINWSIGMCTASGLMVCIVVVGLFVGDFWSLHMANFVMVTFVLSMLLLIIALLLLIREVQLATRLLVAGQEFMEE